MAELEQSTRENSHGGVIAGRNAVLEALKASRQIDALYLKQPQSGMKLTGVLGAILAAAKQRGIVVKYVLPQKLDTLSGGAAHQGVVAVCPAVAYAELPDILAMAEKKGEKPFLIICDEIEDPHNLGAIIRTAEASGAHGLIIPKRRSAGVTQTVYKTSAGAANVLPVCRVSNLRQTVKDLKHKGIWIYCADMDGLPWCEVDYTGGVALIIGSEGKGVSRILKEESDFIVSLPMIGTVGSLNASVAGGIIMYEIARQRLAKRL